MKILTALLTTLFMFAGIAQAQTPRPAQAIRKALERAEVKQLGTVQKGEWQIKESTGPRGGKTFTAFKPLVGGAVPGFIGSGRYQTKGGVTTVRVLNVMPDGE
jgi:hypothetical protein